MVAYRLEKLYGTTYYNTKRYEEGRLLVYYKNNHDLIACIESYKQALKIFKSYGYDLSKCPAHYESKGNFTIVSEAKVWYGFI